MKSFVVGRLLDWSECRANTANAANLANLPAQQYLQHALLNLSTPISIIRNEQERGAMESSNISLVMRDILQTGKYSDFTVKCKDHQFKVHKAIVCSQSPFFDAAVCGGFQVGSTTHCTILLILNRKLLKR